MAQTRRRSTGVSQLDLKSGPGSLLAGQAINAKEINTGPVVKINNFFGSASGTTSEILTKLTARESGVQFARLVTLAKQVKIGPKRLGQLYHDCLPPLATPVATMQLDDILVDLSEQPLMSSNRLPLFDFVAGLAKLAAPGEVRNELQAWLRQAEVNFGQYAAPAAVAAQPPVTTPEPPPQAVLEVQLIPDPGNPNRSKGKLYHVEVSLWKSDVGYLPTFRSPLGNAPLPLDKVPEVLAGVLANTSSLRQVGPLSDLTFEFILPLELLSHAVDRWNSRTQGPLPLERVYGMIHPLVVRSLDRMKFYATNAYEGTLLYDVWKNKWRAFREKVASSNGDTLRWLPLDNQADLRKVIDSLQKDQDALCLGLPDPADERALNTLIWAGVPVALWVREANPATLGGPSLSALLKTTLQGTTLAALPTSIKAARAAGKSYPHNCLALMWDDPTRLPLRYQPEGVFRDEQLESVQGQH